MTPWRWPRVLAHRCGGALAPENSLEGLAAAQAAGVGGVEFDAMLAACATPVLMHDERLERTTDGSGPVAHVPWSALRRLHLRDAHGCPSAARIPTLAAALARCAALGLAANVEIKPAAGFDEATGEAVARAVHGATQPLLLSSFSPAALAAAARLAADVPRALLLDTPPPDACARAAALGCEALVVNVERLEATLIDAAHAAGLTLAVYTENDARRAAHWLAQGLDAVITDRPDALAHLATA